MQKVILTCTLAMLATSAMAKRPLDEVPAASPIGKPVSCIRMSEVEDTRVRNDKVIDFMIGRNKAYRNVLPYECSSLGFEQRFMHKSINGEYCSVDTITVLYSPGLSHGATCGLGEFQLVEFPKPAKKG